MFLRILIFAGLAAVSPVLADSKGVPDFAKDVEPLLIHYCYDCHGDGADKGDLALDSYGAEAERVADHEVWLAVWENLRAGMMPPPEKEQPTTEEVALINRWIERGVFRVDPESPDPGRVTTRRLNREEYQNTIKDLLGVDFDVMESFPPDDSGYGYDHIGDVLSLSPILMEKYLQAAEKIAITAVPQGGEGIPRDVISPVAFDRVHPTDEGNAQWLSLQWAVETKHERWVEHPGEYKFNLRFHIDGSDEATENTGAIILTVDGKEVGRSEYGWDQRDKIYLSKTFHLERGNHTFRLLTEKTKDAEEGQGWLYAHGDEITLDGPLDGSVIQYPPEYWRIFPGGVPGRDLSEGGGERREFARAILGSIASRAFRRPVDEATLDRLVALYEEGDAMDDTLFEGGIAYALTAILSSPRFLFRTETQPDPNDPQRVQLLDEYDLASRLSYFLWRSMPDDRLFKLAKEGKLRENLSDEISRMIDDDKAVRFVTSFVGQWLQVRDASDIYIDARKFTGMDNSNSLRFFNGGLRESIQLETYSFFGHILREANPATELLTADYTFLNDKLSKFYGLPEMKGWEMRKVDLPEGSARGGLLTHASIQIVTSNPTRTSPVKRGLFILDNLLDSPAPPAPPDIPTLEESAKDLPDSAPMREQMAAHASQKLCASCHRRMDPLGLAMEVYNPMGQHVDQWRRFKPDGAIDTAGELMTGESFAGVDELQGVIANERRRDFYRSLTENVLTFALGRGLEYYDTTTVERIVDELLKEGDDAGGSIRSLVHKVIWSRPFQNRRGDGDPLGAGR